MSPTNDNLDMPGDDAPGDTTFELKRTGESPATRNPMGRSKRIRNARRSNTANGMQRRRNKRIDW